MNLKALTLALVGASMAVASTGCVVYSSPTYYDYCYYDYYGYYTCDVYYYNGDGTTDTSRDIITNVAQAEQEKLASQAKHYAEKFSLGIAQGEKIAKTINDFNAVQNRSDADVAEFAQRLYGVNPSEIVAAAGRAQAGDNSKLEEVVGQAATNFATTPENMKKVVKTLHGKMLEQQGIHF